jgi:hypothetical protein
MYLTRTFGLVYQHVKPDTILFLGDLLDEGSSASTEEYHYAYQRFVHHEFLNTITIITEPH